MVKSKKYLAKDKEQYTMEVMVDRVIYWWIRYKGTRTEDGKDFSKSDVRMLSRRLERLAKNPYGFRWNEPDMGDSY